MFVCLCKGLSRHDIQRVIVRGARSVTEIGRCCGAGTECGTCRPMLAQMLAADAASGANRCVAATSCNPGPALATLASR